MWLSRFDGLVPIVFHGTQLRDRKYNCFSNLCKRCVQTRAPKVEYLYTNLCATLACAAQSRRNKSARIFHETSTICLIIDNTTATFLALFVPCNDCPGSGQVVCLAFKWTHTQIYMYKVYVFFLSICYIFLWGLWLCVCVCDGAWLKNKLNCTRRRIFISWLLVARTVLFVAVCTADRNLLAKLPSQ